MYEHESSSFCFCSKECLAGNLESNSLSGIEQHYCMETLDCLHSNCDNDRLSLYVAQDVFHKKQHITT